MKDFLNNEILPGCYIAYAVRYGDSGQIRLYKVKDIKNDKITAVCIDKNFKWDRDKNESVFTGYSVHDKASTLWMSERAIVVKNVPDEIRKLFPVTFKDFEGRIKFGLDMLSTQSVILTSKRKKF